MNTDRFVVSAPAGYFLVTAIGEKLDAALEAPIIAFGYTVEKHPGQADCWTIVPVTLEGPPRRNDTWAIKCPDGTVQEISLSWDRFCSTREFLAKSDTLRRARRETAEYKAFGTMKRLTA